MTYRVMTWRVFNSHSRNITWYPWRQILNPSGHNQEGELSGRRRQLLILRVRRFYSRPDCAINLELHHERLLHPLRAFEDTIRTHREYVVGTIHQQQMVSRCAIGDPRLFCHTPSIGDIENRIVRYCNGLLSYARRRGHHNDSKTTPAIA